MTAPVNAAPKEHNFAIDRNGNGPVRVYCSSCNVTFAEFPIDEEVRITVSAAMKMIERAISEVQSHAGIAGTCNQIYVKNRPFTLED